MEKPQSSRLSRGGEMLLPVWPVLTWHLSHARAWK